MEDRRRHFAGGSGSAGGRLFLVCVRLLPGGGRGPGGTGRRRSPGGPGQPDHPLPSYPTDTAIIFYPGAKVEGAAYLPLLDQLRRTGLTCILVEMPFRMAIFDVNAAEDVMAQFPEIRHRYLAGHSMGGAMASQFAAGHRDQVDGLILLGAYLYGEYPSADTLTVYGSLNQSVEDKIDYTENVVEIEGGNHAQFGNYGPRRGICPPRSRRRNNRPRRWRPSRTSLPNNRSEELFSDRGVSSWQYHPGRQVRF